MLKMKRSDSPLRETMCATCPFRPDSKYAPLAVELAASALTDASRICHSTGSNAINRRTGIKPHLCRGARDIQLKVFHGMGIISAPTDEAWNERRAMQGFNQTEIKNPNERKTITKRGRSILSKRIP